jgi:hypothetical protein
VCFGFSTARVYVYVNAYLTSYLHKCVKASCVGEGRTHHDPGMHVSPRHHRAGLACAHDFVCMHVHEVIHSCMHRDCDCKVYLTSECVYIYVCVYTHKRIHTHVLYAVLVPSRCLCVYNCFYKSACIHARMHAPSVC